MNIYSIIILFNIQINGLLLSKHEVKMTKYWTSFFFPIQSPETCKKECVQYPAILTIQAQSIKDLYYSFWGNFPCGTQHAHLGRRSHSAGFISSCLFTELQPHINKLLIFKNNLKVLFMHYRPSSLFSVFLGLPAINYSLFPFLQSMKHVPLTSMS